jgi:WD40 repeat protein
MAACWRFLVGSDVNFPPSGDVYTVMLPDGEPIPRTHDAFGKYGVAFSPDGSQITYTASGGGWNTMSVPLLGGEPRPLVQNAAGLTWLDPHHILFSEIVTGLHMGLVTATDRRENPRHVYLPKHERGMAHYGYASPDRQSVLIVEMDPTGAFGRCRLGPFDGHTEGSEVGPDGWCSSAAWSPDGRWMYFTAVVDGASHVWREPFPSGALEQITSGPGHGTWHRDESGWAVTRDLAWDPGERRLVAHPARRTPHLTRRVRITFALFARRPLPVLFAAPHRHRYCRKTLADGAHLGKERTSGAESSHHQLRHLSRRHSDRARGEAGSWSG